MSVATMWLINVALGLSTLVSGVTGYPRCIDMADTATCQGISIQVPRIPAFYNNSADLDTFLIKNLNSPTGINVAECSPSLAVDVLIIPKLRAFTCGKVASILIAGNQAETMPLKVWSHCASSADVYTPCRSVCEDAVKMGNEYIDGNCKGDDLARSKAKASWFMCDAYPFFNCNDFSTDASFASTPDRTNLASLFLAMLGITIWLLCLDCGHCA